MRVYSRAALDRGAYDGTRREDRLNLDAGPAGTRREPGAPIVEPGTPSAKDASLSIICGRYTFTAI
jgi:hypothetical protein